MQKVENNELGIPEYYWYINKIKGAQNTKNKLF